MKFRQALFWDVNPKNIDVKKNAPYIIERVLDLGTDSEVRWLWRTYPKSLLRRVVGRSRALRSDTKQLWEHLLQ
ncbi:MAG: hypothetical protein Q8P01_00380 [bacterium]|nr:hypothetical protein [bacterium]